MPATAGSLQHMAAARQVNVDADLLEQTRKAMSPPADAPDAEIVERAPLTYPGRNAMHDAQALSDLTEEQALDLAYSELHAMRAERRRAA
jgi:hypothetical protein